MHYQSCRDEVILEFLIDKHGREAIVNELWRVQEHRLGFFAEHGWKHAMSLGWRRRRDMDCQSTSLAGHLTLTVTAPTCAGAFSSWGSLQNMAGLHVPGDAPQSGS